MSELFVVPGERHVERMARASRLTAALLPDIRFAEAEEAKLTLAMALDEARANAAQLDLFGGAAAAPDPLLAPLRGRGGASWVRAVSAIHEAIGSLRSRGATELHLDRVKGSGVAPARARTLAAAMRALDADLARAGARDARLLGTDLAQAIREAGASRLI